MSAPSAARANRGRRSARPSGDDREQAILETARRLLEEKPFTEISVDDLAKGAGLSRPTFYFYFPSKEAVLLSLLDPLITRADTGFARVSELRSDPPKAFRAGIHTFFDAFASQPVMGRVGAQALSTSPEVRALWTQFMQRWIDQTEALINSERERGAAPETIPARELAIALNQMNERAMVAALTGESASVPANQMVETLAHIWMSSIYGDRLL